jgi:hypothetical protein
MLHDSNLGGYWGLAEGLSIFNSARPPTHLHCLFQRDLNDLRRAIRQPPTFIRLVINLGIRPLTDIDIIDLSEVNRLKAGKQQAADEEA